MRILDLLRMSSSSLWKRKFRTVLTVLGVVIGTASIVVMISLGLGLNKSRMESIEQFGGLTTIEVYEGRGGDGGGMYAVAVSSGSSSGDKAMRLDDAAVDVISGLDYVESVSPVLQVNVIAKYGQYVNDWMNVKGMTPEGLESMHINVGDGHLPLDDGELEFFYGNKIATQFYNPKNYSYPYYETGEIPVDLMNDTLFIIFDQDAYWSSQYGGDDGYGNSVQPPKKYIIKTAGVEQSDGENDWSANSYSIYCNIDALKTTLKRIFRNKAIPGQPTTSSGKPYKDIFYSELQVNVDDVDHVQEVQEVIQSLGYEAYSNIEWIQDTQQELANIQAMLGGIGAVSLLVAAIGIANTMMMSIYERTKEIGVMKVLGCDMRNIQALFLMEAAYIGLIGGVVGLALSYGISAIINKVAAAGGEVSGISYIPLWLSGASVVFAVIIGVLAGFFPSRRAMKLSPLAAIRNE